MQAVNEGDRWMIRLETGEELLESLGRFAEERGVHSAAVGMGIGQLREATLGYWNGQKYESNVWEEATELISLAGSIAEDDGRPSVHLHASLGLRTHATVSGHVLRGTVGLLAEVLVETFPSRTFSRPLDESLGLRTLRLSAAPPPPQSSR
jgi:predicted DNA-binding protein with PD1-like motif